MNKPRIYTLEIYAPCFPGKGIHARWHEGSFEENRESLSPSMIAVKEVALTHQMQTPRAALTRFARGHKVTSFHLS
jgi:hypothetical protein